MADVDSSVVFTSTERKTRKVKKTTKRRESSDQNASEVTITEVDSTQNNNHNAGAIEEYVLAAGTPFNCSIIFSLLLVFLPSSPFSCSLPSVFTPPSPSSPIAVSALLSYFGALFESSATRFFDDYCG